jgi:hypothetical protein
MISLIDPGYRSGNRLVTGGNHPHPPGRLIRRTAILRTDRPALSARA